MERRVAPVPSRGPQNVKLCEKTGRRLRRAGYSAHGVHVAMVFTDLSWWHQGRKFDVPVYTTSEIFVKAQRLLNGSGYRKVVRNLAAIKTALHGHMLNRAVKQKITLPLRVFATIWNQDHLVTHQPI
jgi:impB/mucB/samB family C-terminal domain